MQVGCCGAIGGVFYTKQATYAGAGCYLHSSKRWKRSAGPTPCFFALKPEDAKKFERQKEWLSLWREWELNEIMSERRMGRTNRVQPEVWKEALGMLLDTRGPVYKPHEYEYKPAMFMKEVARLIVGRLDELSNTIVPDKVEEGMQQLEEVNSSDFEVAGGTSVHLEPLLEALDDELETEDLRKYQLEVKMCCEKCEEKVVEEIEEVIGVCDVRAEGPASKVVVRVMPSVNNSNKSKILRGARRVDKKAKFVALDATENPKRNDGKEKEEESPVAPVDIGLPPELYTGEPPPHHYTGEYQPSQHYGPRSAFPQPARGWLY